MKKLLVVGMALAITLLMKTACMYELEEAGVPLGINQDSYASATSLERSKCGSAVDADAPQDAVEEWGTLHRFEQDGLWGFKDDYDNIIVEPQYYWAVNFSEGLAFVWGVEGREYQTGFIDLTGLLVIPLPSVLRAQSFSNGFAAIGVREWDWDTENPGIENSLSFRPSGPVIFIDRTGQNVFNQEFEAASNFNDGLAMVRPYQGNGFYIDRTGQNPFGVEFLITSHFFEGYANVKLLDGTYTHIDRDGNIVDINRIWGQWDWIDGELVPRTYP